MTRTHTKSPNSDSLTKKQCRISRVGDDGIPGTNRKKMLWVGVQPKQVKDTTAVRSDGGREEQRSRKRKSPFLSRRTCGLGFRTQPLELSGTLHTGTLAGAPGWVAALNNDRANPLLAPARPDLPSRTWSSGVIISIRNLLRINAIARNCAQRESGASISCFCCVPLVRSMHPQIGRCLLPKGCTPRRGDTR